MATIPSRKSFSDVARLSSYTPALPGIAELLNKMVTKGDTRGRSEDRTAFDGSKPAPVSIQDYIIRMCKYGYCSHEVFVCMIIYLGRIRARVGTTFTSHNIHRLLLTSFVVAAKLRDDTYYSNKYYASIGGVSLPDMNKMESAFLRSTAWELHISKKEYDQYYAAMTAPAATTTEEETNMSSFPPIAMSPSHASAAAQNDKPRRESCNLSTRGALRVALQRGNGSAAADSIPATHKLPKSVVSAPRGSISSLRDLKGLHSATLGRKSKTVNEVHPDTQDLSHHIHEPQNHPSAFVSC